jgi:hypothetical protein
VSVPATEQVYKRRQEHYEYDGKGCEGDADGVPAEKRGTIARIHGFPIADSRTMESAVVLYSLNPRER